MGRSWEGLEAGRIWEVLGRAWGWEDVGGLGKGLGWRLATRIGTLGLSGSGESGRFCEGLGRAYRISDADWDTRTGLVRAEGSGRFCEGGQGFTWRLAQHGVGGLQQSRWSRPKLSAGQMWLLAELRKCPLSTAGQ